MRSFADPEKLGRILAIVVATLIVSLVILGSLFGLALVLDGLAGIVARETAR